MDHLPSAEFHRETTRYFLEALDSFAFYDPGVLKLFEQNGKPVHVSESSREIVEVPVISEAVAR